MVYTVPWAWLYSMWLPSLVSQGMGAIVSKCLRFVVSPRHNLVGTLPRQTSHSLASYCIINYTIHSFVTSGMLGMVGQAWESAQHSEHTYVCASIWGPFVQRKLKRNLKFKSRFRDGGYIILVTNKVKVNPQHILNTTPSLNCCTLSWSLYMHSWYTGQD